MKVNYLLLLVILIFSANSMDIFGQTNWHKYIGNPVLLPGDEGQWDYQFINVRSVLWDGEKYNMWYQGGDGDNRCFGHATSNDGFNWLKNESNPINYRWFSCLLSIK